VNDVSSSTMLSAYLTALRRIPLDQQTEMTGRAALQALLEAAVSRFGPKDVVVVHEPKRVTEGAPDYKLVQAAGILGYVENKSIGHDLNRLIRRDSQIAKYRKLTPNLLVTDYLRFILVTPGETIEASLGPPTLLEGRAHPVRPERAAEVELLLKRFLSTSPVGIGRARELAQALAVRAELLHDGLEAALDIQARGRRGGKLLGLYKALREQVSEDLSSTEFADAFAQTLVYGLFLAKLNAGVEIVTLENAHHHIPTSILLLRELVDFLPEVERPEYTSFKWVVTEVLSVINGLDLSSIQQDLAFRRRRMSSPSEAEERSEEEWRLFSGDPYIYFYEDFLAKYDPHTRKSRGVYYTPPPVVNFIVRAVHDSLKEVFNISDGLADRHKVTVLDFAAGTGTFIVEVLARIFDEIGGPRVGKAALVVREHMLKNIFGFEYLVAPYTIAHLKLASYLRDVGHSLVGEERLQVYLTNTVEPIAPHRNLFLPALSDETEAAQAIKERKILVITGNPPYSGHSRNNGPVAKRRVEQYKVVHEIGTDGRERIVPLGERNSKWLQDDYVKFIAFAQEQIDRSGEGIVAVITNHSFLDNPTFRGMRQSLMRSFDQIRVVDLHGSAKRRERSPDDLDDENVFDIEQGVAISIFIKKPGAKRGVWRTDLWGKRQAKYEWAARSKLSDVPWTEIEPRAPLYLFRLRDHVAAQAYDAFPHITDIFPVNVLGYQTHRDHFAIAFDRSEIESRVAAMVSAKLTDQEIKEQLRLTDNRDWNVKSAREGLRKNGRAKKGIVRTLYRPFDIRWCHFGYELMDYPRSEIIQHVVGRTNLQLLVPRQVTGDWGHVCVSDLVAESCVVSSRSKEQNYTFPLYLYSPPAGSRPRHADLFGTNDPFEGKARIENIGPAFRQRLDTQLGYHHSAETVFGYVYAILHAPTYRETYADFLMSDFPRIPIPSDNKAFEHLAALGNALIEAHLLRTVPRGGLGEFSGQGSQLVEEVRYDPENHWLHINATQSFRDVPADVWDFFLGGYQVLEKYLKERRGRVLTLDDIETFEAITNVVAFTIERMNEIDAAYAAAFLQ
jgi:hypothetical protein